MLRSTRHSVSQVTGTTPDDCWIIVGNKEKEISCIEKAYELNPRNDKTAFEYAEFQAEIGNIELARKVFMSNQVRRKLIP